MFIRTIACFFLVFMSAHADAFQNEEWNLLSPDKKVCVTVSSKSNQLHYTVSYEKRVALESSPLGIVRDDQQFSSNLKFVSKKENTIDEKYTLSVGRRLQCHNHANELTLTFENENKKQVYIILRAYNDGMAYRYHFPGAADGIHKIMKEESGFAVPKTAKAWIQPYDLNVRSKPCYEAFYENGIAVGRPSPNPAGWAFPALFNVNNLWLLITEAALDEHYPGTHLEDKNGNAIYTIRFPEKEEATSSADPEPTSQLPWTTPWRAVVIGTSLATIQETSLVANLNPPSVIEDASWVKPGRSSWSWWSAGGTTRDFNVQKEYIDFTADMTWEYVLIDAGWPDMKGGSMEDLVKYANSKNVGIVLWYHSGMGREKDTLSYANLMAFPEERKKEFQKIQAWGVKGIKVDFFDSDKQPVIQRYYDILRDAADHKIMVNFHGSTLPRGWERTYPHVVSMESVKGAEGAGRQEFCDRAPVHNTILPFTRNVVGSMDYTPVTFTNKREAKRQTTFAHELALSVVFESGIFHFADNMKSYQALPEQPKNFLRKVPTAWDETRYIAGVPGKYTVVARRKGNAWYIAGINGQLTEQEVSFDLPFINKETTLNMITDGKDSASFATESMKTKGKNIKIKLVAKGGFVLY
ncbi:glycoside hydrolase family 97 protein [Ohtaekwangia koreensis]|uniref:Glycosyl-hydrolase 97 C-terminal, oligomerisation n=1 Tax=Ohtaekwangia koreensis TaxID=688867 RepID=A0A1T5M6X4_9BACT|nr:glycoside hydrolase family 97 protein [Ohtaekwangia koreensis]SKC83977.1 Glycosyl-hydrolase 97 C-terminal, oligomerisation [Ohtaekwangia koreensis]